MARVLLLTHIYPPAIDGGSKIIAKIGDYLESHGHQVLVITSNCTSSDDFSRLKHPTTSHSKNIISLPVITFLHRPLKFLSRFFPNFKTLSKGPIFSSFSFLISSLKFKPDFIIAGPLPTTIIIYAYLINYLSNHLFHYSPKLLINPCFHPNDPDFQTPLLLSLLNKSDYLWCLTNYEQKYFQNKLNITHPKYIVHGLGVDSDFIISLKDIKYPKNPHIVFIANFSAHKRTELLILAFEQVLIKYPTATLTLLGQKTLYFPNIINFLKTVSPKTKSHIKFVFKPRTTQIKKALDSASCLVLPSVHESFGLVLIESLARGKAVIGANTPQTTEVIQRLGGGLTFKTDDLASLSDTIIKLIESPSYSKKLAGYAYQTIKKSYTWDKIGENLCKKLGI